MLRCKKVGEALNSTTHYEDLPFLKRLGVRFHIRMCGICGKFHRDIMVLQDGSKTYRDQEEDLGENCCMSTTRKQAMRDALEKAAKEETNGVSTAE